MNSAQRMRQLITGYRVSAALHAAAELGLSDLLTDGPRTVHELAAATGCAPRPLRRLLRALSTVEVYQELPDDRFGATELSDELIADSGGNNRALAVLIGRPYMWQTWTGLTDAVRTGELAFEAVHGTTAWAYRAIRPEESTIFDAAMTAMSVGLADGILRAYDFGQFATVVDVGGGRGALLAAILAAHPGTHGVLFDQPHVVAEVAPALAAADVHSRCTVVGGDMFAEVPAGGDAYVLKAIVHDWDDPEALTVLANCRRAMTEAGTLLIVERLLDTRDQEAAFSDLNMMVGPGGLERTTQEYTELLSRAGFRLLRTVPAGPVVSVLEAVPTGP